MANEHAPIEDKLYYLSAIADAIGALARSCAGEDELFAIRELADGLKRDIMSVLDCVEVSSSSRPVSREPLG